VGATAVEYFSVHDLPPIEGPRGKGCACWAAIARQIAVGLFPLHLQPQLCWPLIGALQSSYLRAKSPDLPRCVMMVLPRRKLASGR
jgi:hypothetical protein